MAILDFGYTWWGKKWLDALISTDYSNRLPRGKSYARKGAVSSISISGKKVSAKVQGSRRTPYNVSLSLKAFTSKENRQVLDIIVNNSLYLGALLNRKLPTELYQEFENNNIRLFPKTWSDVNADCSCPDWASCCKHIAAVIYMIANAIDKNPFLVFELHGLDIFAELEKQGFVIAGDEQNIIKSYASWLEKAKKIDQPLNLDAINKLDFSLIPCLNEQIFSLLEDNPLFYSKGDFKKILNRIYKAAAKINEQLPIADDSQNSLVKASDLTIEFDNLLDEKIILQTNNIEKKKNKITIEFNELNQMLQSIPAKKLPACNDKIVFLYFLRHFALKLLQQNAFIPEIIELKEGCYRIRWLPALLNNEVRGIFRQLENMTPKMINLASAKNQQIRAEESVKTILSLFLQSYITESCLNIDIDWHDEIISLFFNNDILEIKNFSGKEIPITIALWLSKFYLTHKTYIPVLKIEEFKNTFAASILVENQNKPLDALIPLSQIFSKNQYQAIAVGIFKDLQLLENYFPEIAVILKTKGVDRALISNDDFPNVLFKQLPVLKMLGIPLLLPKGLEQVVRPKLSLSVKTASTATAASYLSLQEMLNFNWEIALGDQHISPHEFQDLLKNSNGIVKIKDQFVYFDDKEIQKILRDLENTPQLSTADKMRIIVAEEYKDAKINMNSAVKKLLKSLNTIEKVSLPKALQANLRPYQKRGYEWLYKNANFGFGSLIADDMGLGKTVQIICLLLKLKTENKLKKHPALIIVPTSLLSNWQAEIDKFAPDLKTHIYHGVKRELILKNQDVLITSYGLLRRDVDAFAKQKWPAIIIDEAQNIKNPATAQTKAIKKLKTDTRIAMTGTPVENRLSEYWSIFDFLNKGYLYNLEKFKQEFAVPIEIDRDRKCLETFQKSTAPFILRRLKTDKTIIKDLPDKIEIDQYNKLSKEQAALYQSVVNNIMQKIENSEGIERRGLIFKLMTSLKQICNHPAHYQKKQEIIPELSGKTSVLLELLKTIYENNEKVLIFTQYKEMGALLQKLISEQHQTESLFFHGGLTRSKRDNLVEAFQNDPKANTMLLSLKAGGTGLNLTAAKNVIHFDLWWNPAVEAQATDRAYRIGQTQNVMVYRMITKDTFEEKINKMLMDKKELANLTVSTGEKWIGEFSNEELQNIFGLSEEAREN